MPEFVQVAAAILAEEPCSHGGLYTISRDEKCGREAQLRRSVRCIADALPRGALHT